MTDQSQIKKEGRDEGGLYGVDPDETVVSIGHGQSLVFEDANANPNGTDYVRFIRDRDQKELVYWSHTEWAEAPEEVMGAIMGCIHHGANRRGKPDPRTF